MLRALVNRTARVTRALSGARSGSAVLRQRGTLYSTKPSDLPGEELNDTQEATYEHIEAALNKLGFDRVVCIKLWIRGVSSPQHPLMRPYSQRTPTEAPPRAQLGGHERDKRAEQSRQEEDRGQGAHHTRLGYVAAQEAGLAVTDTPRRQWWQRLRVVRSAAAQARGSTERRRRWPRWQCAVQRAAAAQRSRRALDRATVDCTARRERRRQQPPRQERRR